MLCLFASCCLGQVLFVILWLKCNFLWNPALLSRYIVVRMYFIAWYWMYCVEYFYHTSMANLLFGDECICLIWVILCWVCSCFSFLLSWTCFLGRDYFAAFGRKLLILWSDISFSGQVFLYDPPVIFEPEVTLSTSVFWLWIGLLNLEKPACEFCGGTFSFFIEYCYSLQVRPVLLICFFFVMVVLYFSSQITKHIFRW